MRPAGRQVANRSPVQAFKTRTRVCAAHAGAGPLPPEEEEGAQDPSGVRRLAVCVVISHRPGGLGHFVGLLKRRRAQGLLHPSQVRSLSVLRHLRHTHRPRRTPAWRWAPALSGRQSPPHRPGSTDVTLPVEPMVWPPPPSPEPADTLLAAQIPEQSCIHPPSSRLLCCCFCSEPSTYWSWFLGLRLIPSLFLWWRCDPCVLDSVCVSMSLPFPFPRREEYSRRRNGRYCPSKLSQYQFWDIYLCLPGWGVSVYSLFRGGQGKGGGLFQRPHGEVASRGSVHLPKSIQARAGLPPRWPVGSKKQYRHSRRPPPW